MSCFEELEGLRIVVFKGNSRKIDVDKSKVLYTLILS